MNIKKYFWGKTGCLFWLNVILIVMLLAAVPVALYFTLDSYTHHGEKIKIPTVVGKKTKEAIKILEKTGFTPIVSDSVYRRGETPGIVLSQNPRQGSITKSSHLVYLTVSMYHEPLVKFPDIAGNCAVNQAEAELRAMGFEFTPNVLIGGYHEGLVVKVEQSKRSLKAGDMVSKSTPLTLFVGAGVDADVYSDSIMAEYAPAGDYDNETLSPGEVVTTEEVYEDATFDVVQ